MTTQIPDKSNILQHAITAIHGLVTGGSVLAGTTALNNGDNQTALFAYIVTGLNMLLQWAHLHQSNKAAAAIVAANTEVQNLISGATTIYATIGQTTGSVTQVPPLVISPALVPEPPASTLSPATTPPKP